MIAAAGLSPALQHILVFDSLRVGEVNRAREVRWCASGKVLNAALAARSLGADVDVVTVLGGEWKSRFEEELTERGIRTRSIACGAPTRVCTTVLDHSGGRTTELVEEAGRLGEDEVGEFVRVLGLTAASARVVLLTGSLPAGVPRTLYRDVLGAARGAVILDARGPELLAALPLRPFLVKPNRTELAMTLGRPLESEADVAAGIEELRSRGAAWVAVTHGKDEVLVGSPEGLFALRPPHVAVVNPIGSGDSMAGAFAWAIERGDEPIDALRAGIGAAAHNAEQLLMGRLDLGRVEALARQVEVRRI